MSNKDSNPFARALEELRLKEYGRFFSNPLVLASLRRMSELSTIGARIIDAARKPRSRRHDLGDLIERTYKAIAADGKAPAAEEVLDALEDHDEEDTIQEITDDAIHWIDWRGKEHKMKISTFRNWLSKLRKAGRQS